MGIRGNSNRLLNPEALKAMDKFKVEAAQELNVSQDYKSGYWGNMTSRECGAVGGQMVKKMIAEYQNNLANGNATPQAGAATKETIANDAKDNYNLANKAGSFVPQQ
ncbi:small, acid-soluble spore protein, alpha/beta type [Halobacteroides halobius DSM 5150]|uniref:Small, acid-soluble spore protein, alpha/beta type n=1 Tax=Halobacteroides halobius (strain ATCC 35273 / DSM 5150 / MD-1) TaxID=748449 RepID=L0KBU1_HALHC|nr:alpha/beta-type small acid-soluble spore protein [Halobacteroides halobius]AGB41819.1 small, acid-soluble spore protein, alpha/beta type [Halobacteroides halobius DSM 5150]